jgi:hypothetical protein
LLSILVVIAQCQLLLVTSIQAKPLTGFEFTNNNVSPGRFVTAFVLALYDNGGTVSDLEHLLLDVKESLERELGGLRQDMQLGFSQLNARFDTQAARLDRHAGLWQAGTRWSSRMDAWAEKVDAALEARDREIADLRERLIKLERRSA